MEQQADRAIALTKSIQALSRDFEAPAGPTITLDELLTDLLNELAVVINSGLLRVERRGDPSIRVTSSPILRQVLALLVSKLLGRNPRPLTLTVAAATKRGLCDLELRWLCRSDPHYPAIDAATILAKDLKSVQEILYLLGADLELAERHPAITLKLPATSPAFTHGAAVAR